MGEAMPPPSTLLVFALAALAFPIACALQLQLGRKPMRYAFKGFFASAAGRAAGSIAPAGVGAVKREVRRQRHLGADRPLVVVDSKAWVIVRRADLRGAAPFLISRKEWDALPQEPWLSAPCLNFPCSIARPSVRNSSLELPRQWPRNRLSPSCQPSLHSEKEPRCTTH